MILWRLRRLAIPVILTALTACDNVQWEGIEVRLEAPPSTRDTARVEAVEEEPDRPPPLELGPVLYAVERTDDETVLLPVAEIDESGALASLPVDEVEDFGSRFARQRMSRGARFDLYASGVRVGTFHATGSASPDTTLCAPRPGVRGRIEIAPGAVDAQRFLALESDGEGAAPPGEFRPRRHTRTERVASLNLAAGLFNELQAPWPADLVQSRADIQVFRPGDGASTPSDSPFIAATFLFRDRMGVVDAPDAAWSIFFLAEPRENDYEPTYVWYRTVGEEGRGVPRFWEHGDWDRDDRDEVLLEVLGTESRWFAALARGPEGWSRTFEEPCGRSS